MTLYLLFESASGYALFERTESDEIGMELPAVQASVSDLGRFSKIIKLKAFFPFKSAEDALDNINKISEGEVSETLLNFLELNLGKGKAGKQTKFTLGVTDPRIGSIVSETLKIKCESNELTAELVRGIRLHFFRFIKGLKKGDLNQAQLGLSHSYSRGKVKFNVHKVDNMIIQAIALLDQLDKDLNTFAMRVREWYSWHFPELIQIVNDNYQFCRCANFIKHKESLKPESAEGLKEIVGDDAKAQEILEAAKMSMGTDISEIDMVNIERFATRVIKLAEYRQQLHKYLISKMNTCAPNLAALIGEQVGARLISHAGSLTNLAKYPASTVQILGAEKALFRALKTKGNTPKYGLIFHSTFIGRATPKNKGRISRYLANKCSIASRIDCFSDAPTTKFGELLKEQVEERLEFYKSGKAPRKNADVMKAAIDDLGGDITAVDHKEEAQKKKKKKDKKKDKGDKGEKSDSKKRKAAEPEDEEDGDAAAGAGPAPMEVDEPKPKKQKKDKKKEKKERSLDE